MFKSVILILFLFLSNSFFLSAHEEESHEPENTSSSFNPGNLRPEDSVIDTAGNISGENEAEGYEFNISDEIWDHLHNKMVHVPIGMAIAGFILTWFKRKWPEINKVLIVIAIIGTLGAVITISTGVVQEQAHDYTAKKDILDMHLLFGFSIMIFFFIWLIFLIQKELKKWDWIPATILFIAILITGFYGGVLAH